MVVVTHGVRRLFPGNTLTVLVTCTSPRVPRGILVHSSTARISAWANNYIHSVYSLIDIIIGWRYWDKAVNDLRSQSVKTVDDEGNEDINNRVDMAG